MSAFPAVAVIGAGIAGSACARALAARGVACVLFDKGRGPGGRLSARRVETSAGEARFDHGAQYLTARRAVFRSMLEELETKGMASRWTGRLVRISASGAATPLPEEDRWVGTPGMNAIVRGLLEGLNAEHGRRALKLEGGAGAWRIRFEDGAEAGPFEAVALTVPPEQLSLLLRASEGDHAGLIAQADAARLSPNLTVMALYDATLEAGFDGARIEGGAVGWAARMASRPGRPELEAVVLQAGADWSRAHLEDAPDDVAAALTREMSRRFGWPGPSFAQAHRWRYALVSLAAETPFALDEAGVGAAGDWRLGPRAEDAFESGEALARAIAARL